MRGTDFDATVRLYHLSDEPGAAGAATLMYGPLAEAMRMAESQPEEIQAGLFLATNTDVVAWLELRDSLLD